MPPLGFLSYDICPYSYFLRNYDVRLLGTPDDEMWPGVSKLSYWHEFPQWNPQNLSSSVPNLDKDGLDLLSVKLHIKRST